MHMKVVRCTFKWPLLEQRVKELRKNGKTIVFTNGCFDGLHPGHLALLAFARDQGDYVIVGLNSDNSVRLLKGDDRPIHGVEVRAEALLHSGYVDTVVFFDMPSPLELICSLKPDVLIKGDDYLPEQIVGAQEVLANGGTVKIFQRIPGYSTSTLLANKNDKKKETK
ncbi:MAG: adenylyltransferase/cytidyltransferase family protein [FCB group bacterium]|nr:adenylyltransferase/cytidyltransferase family protein [FCB group bacterium]